MADMTRREALATLAAAPLVALTWTSAEAEQASLRAVAARKAAAAAGETYQPQFFTAHEYETVRVLVDMILPADERSGSATDAGVPEFMDFIMIDMPQRQEAMRRGWPGWTRTAACATARTSSRRPTPSGARCWTRSRGRGARRPEVADGVAFFNSFRDLAATGFFTSKMGMEDLRYMGNTYVAEWTGCPPEALAKLGLTDV